MKKENEEKLIKMIQPLVEQIIKEQKLNEEFPDDPIYGNDTREYYYKVADNLPQLMSNLDLAVRRGSKVAVSELKIYKAMVALMEKSTLGKIL